MSILNIRTITPSLTDIKDYTPVLKIGDKYLVNGIGGDFIPVKGTVIEDATATASDILEGKIAYNNEGKVTGTYKPLDITDATAQAGDIVEGKTAYIKSGKVTGTYVPSSGGGAFYKCSAVYQGTSGGSQQDAGTTNQNFILVIPSPCIYAGSYSWVLQDKTTTGHNRVWKTKNNQASPQADITQLSWSADDGAWSILLSSGQMRFFLPQVQGDPWDGNTWTDISDFNTYTCAVIKAEKTGNTNSTSSGNVQGYTLGFHAVCQMEGMTPETVDYIFTMQDTAKTGWERTWLSSDGTLRLQAKVYIQQTPGSDVDDSARTWFITSQPDSSTNIWEANQGGSDGAADPWGETEMMYAENGMSYNLTWTPQSGGGSSQSSNSSEPQGASWSGYKAILSSGKYSFSTTQTTGLKYTSVKPVVGGIYTQDALAKLAFLYSGVPVQGLSVYIPFTQQASKAETGQTLSVWTGTPQYITYKGLQSTYFNSSSIIECAVTGFPDFTNKWTVSLWFSSQNKTDDKTLMQIASSHNTYSGIRFVVFQSKICCDNITSSPASSSGVSADFNINTWYHICATYTDGTLKLYVNGQLQSTLNTTIHQFTKSYARIGGYNSGSNRFKGYVTDFRIYDRAVSDSQVVLLHDMLTPTT